MPVTPVPTQLKFSVPPLMYAKLKSRAENAGVQVTSYVRHLLIAGLENAHISSAESTDDDFERFLDSRPTYRASARVERAHTQVMKEIERGVGVSVLHDSADVDAYFAGIKASVHKSQKHKKNQKK